MNTTRGGKTQRGFGLAASVPAEVSEAAALAVQDGGYSSFWLNNPPGAHALQTLGEISTRITLWLGVGVIPLSHYDAAQIERDLNENDLPLDRFYLGLGSGGGSGGVERVAEGVRAIRPQLDCRIVVAALGPRMCRLAGEIADGVLFNWLTPDFARQSIAWVQEGAERASKPVPWLQAYVRVALGDQASRRLEGEAANYQAIPAYAAHFARMGKSAMGTAVTGATPQAIQDGLARWNDVVDEVVIRAITAHDSSDEVSRLIEAARPTT